MTGHKRSTEVHVAFLLAMLLLSFSVLSSFTGKIRVSGPPQSISNKYEAAFYGLFDSQHIAVITSSIRVDVPAAALFSVLAVSNEDFITSRPTWSLYVRPPPLAKNDHYVTAPSA